MEIDRSGITAVILAGGRASRMGGNDKGLVEVNGKPMVSIIADQLSPQVDTLLVNANRNLLTYRDLGFTVVQDSLEDFQGPLAGMLSAIQHCQTDWVVTLPCDGPFLDPSYVEKMMAPVSASATRLVVASDGDRLQPVYALLHRDLLDSLQAYLGSGQRKIDRWYETVGYATAQFAQQMFTNLNTPDQLAELNTA